MPKPNLVETVLSENCPASGHGVQIELIDPFCGKLPTRGKTSILHVLVLQIMDGLYQLSQRTRLDGVSSLLEVHDC